MVAIKESAETAAVTIEKFEFEDNYTSWDFQQCLSLVDEDEVKQALRLKYERKETIKATQT